nr:synaptobrevin, longin-like domain protein [Tanacetum cinerariifolium]
TARIETTEEGTKILATVDGKLRTISESSIRRNLKLNDEAGISSLPDAEFFENLQLMRYNILPNQKFTFQKGQFSHQWKYLIYTIMQCLSPKSIDFNEFSSNITTALVCLATNRVYNFSKMIFDDQDRANIAKTSTLPSDSTPRATSFAADEGSMQQKLNELTALCTSLQRQQSEMISKFALQELEINRLKARIKLLQDKDRGVAEQSGDDAPIKGRSILTSGGVQVVLTAAEVATATVSIPTGSGVVSTASPIIPTAALILTTATESTPYIRRKAKEKMVESDTPKKKKLQEQIDVQVVRELEEQMAREDQRIPEQIARDAKVVRIHVEEELQMMINSLDRNNERVVKYLQEYKQIPKDISIGERIELISDLTNDFKGMSFEQIEAKFNTVWKQIEDFIPMGSKEEAERPRYFHADREGLSSEEGSGDSYDMLQTSSGELLSDGK